jgi:hypothetical protein
VLPNCFIRVWQEIGERVRAEVRWKRSWTKRKCAALCRASSLKASARSPSFSCMPGNTAARSAHGSDGARFGLSPGLRQP